MKILLKRGFFIFSFFTLLLFTRCECPTKRNVVPKRVNIPKKTLQQTYHEKVKEKELGTEGKLTYEEKEKLVDKAYEGSKEGLEQWYKQKKERMQDKLSQAENEYNAFKIDSSNQKKLQEHKQKLDRLLQLEDGLKRLHPGDQMEKNLQLQERYWLKRECRLLQQHQIEKELLQLVQGLE